MVGDPGPWEALFDDVREARITARVKAYFREAWSVDGVTMATVRELPSHTAGRFWLNVLERCARRFPVRGDGT